MKIQPDTGGRFSIGPPRSAGPSGGSCYNYSFEIVGMLGERLASVTVACDGVHHELIVDVDQAHLSVRHPPGGSGQVDVKPFR